MKCRWCNKETEGETFFYCSYWHKVNHRYVLEQEETEAQFTQDWELSFLPLGEGGFLKGG